MSAEVDASAAFHGVLLAQAHLAAMPSQRVLSLTAWNLCQHTLSMVMVAHCSIFVRKDAFFWYDRPAITVVALTAIIFEAFLYIRLGIDIDLSCFLFSLLLLESLLL